MHHTGLEAPKGVWWKPAHRSEKIWVTIAFAWCMVLFAMMPLWHLKGGQNPSGVRHRVEPADFRERTNQFIADFRVGTESGLPVVEPPPGSDVYLMGMMWTWTPILRLQAGAEYTVHLSSVDVNHGFNLFPHNVNFQVVPGYDYALRMVPGDPGEFGIVCNEFCGIGHHQMVGKIVVIDPSEAGTYGDGEDDEPATGPATEEGSASVLGDDPTAGDEDGSDEGADGDSDGESDDDEGPRGSGGTPGGER